MKKYLILLILFTLFGCIYSTQFIPGSTPRDELYLLWALGDLQPRNETEYKEFPLAINDVLQNFPKIDIAINVGDIVQRGNEDSSNPAFRWYEKNKKKSGIKYWYEVIGNHDARNVRNYLRFINLPLHYAVFHHNILYIFLSDELDSSGTDVPPYIFEWWKKLIIENQDKIIITVTHSNLDESHLGMSGMRYRNVMFSDQFAKVLKNYKVDIWLSGHTHIPSYLGKNENRNWFLNNTLFLNVSSIRKDYSVGSIESRFLIFHNNDNHVIIKTRNHEKKKFVNLREINLKLSKKFIKNNKSPKIIIPEL